MTRTSPLSIDPRALAAAENRARQLRAEILRDLLAAAAREAATLFSRPRGAAREG